MSTPKLTGIVACRRSSGDAARGLAGDVIEVRRGAADHRAERDHRVDAAAIDHAAHDLRQLPGAGAAHDRDVVRVAARAHDRVERARDQRLDDEPVEPARDDREPQAGGGQGAFDGGRHARPRYIARSSSRARRLPHRHRRRNRHALDDIDAEALEAGDLAVAPHHQADLVAAEVGEHLRAEAEVAQRLARLVERRRSSARATSLLQHEPLERLRRAACAPRLHDVEEHADAGVVDRLERADEIGTQVERIGERIHRCDAHEHGAARRRHAGDVAADEREVLGVLDLGV